MAIRVKMKSLLHPTDPVAIGTPDYSSFEGQTMWVGAPVEYTEMPVEAGSFIAAQLQCTPEFRDWGTLGVINIYGPEIMPSSVYDVQEIHIDCTPSLNVELAYSDPLVVPTAHWGDVVAPFAGDPGNTLPVDFNDISACVQKFLGDPSQTMVRMKLSPGMLDLTSEVDFRDIAGSVEGFLNEPYTLDGPRVCP